MKRTLALLISSVILITSCASARLAPLQNLSTENAHFIEERNGLTIAVKKLSGNESKKYFGYNFLKSNVQPIQISIQNLGNEYFIFKENNYDLISQNNSTAKND